MPQDNQGHGEACDKHIVGYGAAYFQYLWSWTEALDIFNTRLKDNLMDVKEGQRLGSFLKRLGGQNPTDSFIGYIGREPKNSLI